MMMMTSDELLVQWCRFGWAYRGVGRRPRAEQEWIAERVRYELSIIAEKDFSDYFLMISDTVRWAKDNGIPVGPGRGSVAASVVAWLIRITEVDPSRYRGMLFERFIDVSRADPPDIDMDFADERREDVYSYIAGKFGSDCVGHIANFVRYRGKNSVADVARVYKVPFAATEDVKSRIIERSGGDSRFDSTLEDTLEMFPAAKAVFDNFPDLWKATRLEGNVRGMSVHAAGLLVSGSPLTEICAVYERAGVRCVSIDKYDAEYVDALKLDFLGLSTMGMVARCLELAGLTLEDLYAIEDTDKETMDVFRRGDVTGVFQFEGRATRLVNRDVHPDNFAQVADINALSRPGPLFSGTTAEYVDVKHGRRKATRLHPIVDEITQDTFGQIIYQEQILRIVRDIGGFDWTHAGEIRRIISKKLGEAAFQVSYENFAEGAERLHGIPREVSDKIWKRLVTSGTYSFNIAHAISYSMLAFWTAWLKCHYPLQFYAASLAKAGDQEAQYKLMRDALGHDISISPPVLNASARAWRPFGYLTILAGWEQIPGIGAKTAERIDEMRWPEGTENKGNKFSSWDDLQQIPGIGPKTVQTMEMFATARDPFGLQKTEETLAKVLKWLKSHRRSAPFPTHNGAEISAIHMDENRGKFRKGPLVIYAGIARQVAYQDTAENIRSRTGEEMEDILRKLKRPDLLAYCSIRCYDTTDEEVYLRVNRWVFPRLKNTIDSIAVGHDVIIAVGNRISGFGTPVMVDKLFIIDPEG
jgi:DNA polymerase-3 subunit alpha